MPEPEILRRGKLFHKLVQQEWLDETNDGEPRPEFTIPEGIAGIARRSRLDILVDELGGFVSIVEIKSTDWDVIKVKNRKKLLGSHRRQLWRYIDQYVEKGIDVAPGMIYPSPPLTLGLRELVEEYLNDWAIQVVWFHEALEASTAWHLGRAESADLRTGDLVSEGGQATVAYP